MKRVVAAGITILAIAAIAVAVGLTTMGELNVGLTGGTTLIQQCYDSSYVSGLADHVIDGTVIATGSDPAYSLVRIDQYEKGAPYTVTMIRISGNPGAEQPILSMNQNVRLFLMENSGQVSLVCGIKGVQQL